MALPIGGIKQLAASLFSTGPQDRLVTADIYGVTNGNPINNVDAILNIGLAGIIQQFRSSSGNIPGLGSLINQGVGGLSLNVASLTNRISSVLGALGSPNSVLSSAIQSRVLTQGNFSTNGFPGLSTTIGGVVSNIATSNLDGAGGIIDAINSITGSSALANIIDIPAASAILSVVMQEAIGMGIQGAVEALVGNAPTSEVANNALRANATYAVHAGDIATITTIASTVGPGYINSQIPNSAQTLLANYRLPANTLPSGYAALYITLLNTLNTIQPGWDTYQRNGVAVSNLSAFALMSSDAIALFTSQNAYPVEVTIAKSYQSVDLVKEAQLEYPYMLVYPTRSTNVVTNPQTAA